ncbi:probable ferric reductase transmembrane component 8 [Diutina catenulata]
MDWLDGIEFHFPTKKTPESSRERDRIGSKWGVIATAVVWAMLAVIPIYNLARKRGYRLVKSHWVLPRLSQWLSRVSEEPPSERSRLLGGVNPGWKARVACHIKSWTYWFAVNWNALLRVVFWAVLLSVLAVAETRQDWVYLAKRLGRIPAVCMPPILFLTLRPSPLPDTLYLNLLPIHKWMSRIVVVQAIAHTVIYLRYFQFKSGHIGKAWKLENVYGWVALLGFVVIGVSSVSRMRDRYYRFFYVNHYIWTWIIVGMLQVHIRPWRYRWYTVANVAILVGQIAARIRMSCRTARFAPQGVEVSQASPSFTLVQFPREFLPVQPRNPGAHLRLSIVSKNWFRRMWQHLVPLYHPYTLASLPSDKTQSLIIRQSTFQLPNHANYLICAAYDPKLLFLQTKKPTSAKNKGKFQISRVHLAAKRLLIVIGGSAISFALPLIRVATYHGIPVKVVWVVRDFRDVQVLKHYENVVSGDDFEIFITGEPSLSRRRSFYFDRNSMEDSEFDPELTKRMASNVDDNRYENVEIDVEPAPEGKAVSRGTSPFHGDDCASSAVTEPTPTSSSSESSPLQHKPSLGSINDQFEVYYSKVSSDTSKNYVTNYRDTVDSLGIGHRVYKGRPCLDHRYLDWCINEGFTQCSGPVHDGDNLVCCRAVQPNRVREQNLDPSKVWVVSAGPSGLVKNVSLWASQNGLNFHKESFSV